MPIDNDIEDIWDEEDPELDSNEAGDEPVVRLRIVIEKRQEPLRL
jgi:hypothetical protein